jgi:AraC-like DNA-binding protein
MDPLADVLDVSRVGGALFAHVRAYGPWGIAFDRDSGAGFHAITAGVCWLCTDEAPPCQLMPGDVVLLPTGMTHRLCSAPDEPSTSFDSIAVEHGWRHEEDLLLPGSGACTRFLCAAYDYDHGVAQPLLSLLPSMLHIPAGGAADPTPLQRTIRLLTDELATPTPGARVVVDRLVDVILVQVVRAWLDGENAADASWLRGLRDPVVARAIGLLHDRPELPWTVERLAKEVSVSRATLARRFAELVGDPPLRYLTRWRMDLAARRLRETTDPLEAIARSVGYTSEFAFSRAFSRMRNEPPGRYRRRARAARRED